MSCLVIHIPHETARLFSSIEVPGTRTPLDELHVTVMYLGDDVSIKDIATAITNIYRVTSDQYPFSIKINKVKCFDVSSGDKDYTIIASVVSPELHEFRDLIKSALDKAGVDYPKTYPTYKPHLTLSYSPKKIKEIELEEPIVFGVPEVVLWCGEHGDDEMSVHFPFTIGRTKAKYAKTVLKGPNKLPAKFSR